MRNGGYDGEEFQCGRETAGQRAGAVSREDILGIGSGFTDMHGGIACSSGFSAECRYATQQVFGRGEYKPGSKRDSAHTDPLRRESATKSVSL